MKKLTIWHMGEKLAEAKECSIPISKANCKMDKLKTRAKIPIREIRISHDGKEFCLATTGIVEADRIEIDNCYFINDSINIGKIFNEKKIIECEFKRTNSNEKQNVKCMVCSIIEYRLDEKYSIELVIIGV